MAERLRARAEIVRCEYGYPSPRIQVSGDAPLYRMNHRKVAAAVYTLAAAVERASLGVGFDWVVVVRVDRGQVSLEDASNGRADAAMKMLEKVAEEFNRG